MKNKFKRVLSLLVMTAMVITLLPLTMVTVFAATPIATAIPINSFSAGTLNGYYVYTAGSGGTAEKIGSGGSQYKWQISTDNSTWSDISGASGQIATASIIPPYTVVAGDVGKYVRFGIQPVNTDATPTTGLLVNSTGVKVGTPSAASAFPVSINGTSVSLKGSYYFYTNGGSVEKTGTDGSTYKWQISTNNSTWTDISGASGTVSTSGTIPVYAVADGDRGKYFRFLITPINSDSTPVSGVVAYSTSVLVPATGTFDYSNTTLPVGYTTLSAPIANTGGDNIVIVDAQITTPSSGSYSFITYGSSSNGNPLTQLQVGASYLQFNYGTVLPTTNGAGGTSLLPMVPAPTASTAYNIRQVIDLSSHKVTLLWCAAGSTNYQYFKTDKATSTIDTCYAYGSTPSDIYKLRNTAGTISNVKIYRYATGGAVNPSATVSVSGTYEQGQTLTPSYTYSANDGGTEVSSPYVWETATNSGFTSGVATVASGNTTSAESQPTYTIQSADVGKYIRFRVTPKGGNSTLHPFSSPSYTWTSYSASPATAPVASSVSISGYTLNAKTGDVLTPSYSYNDANSDAESGSTYQWTSSTDNVSFTAISGASGTTTAGTTGTNAQYTVQATDVGKYIRFEITPKNGASALDTGSVATSSSVQALTARYVFNENFETGYTAGTSAAGATVNGWVAASGNTITVTGASSGDPNTSWFVSSGDASKALTNAINNSSGDKIIVVDARVKTSASGSTYFFTRGSTSNNFLSMLQVGGDFIQYTGVDYQGTVINLRHNPVTSNTWYYVRQVINFQNKTVTAYIGTTLDNMTVFKTNGVPNATSTVNFSGGWAAPATPAVTDLKSFRISGGIAIDDIKVYYEATAPVASSVSINGTNQLVASYAYSDADGDNEGMSAYKWYSSPNNTTWTAITGAAGTTTATAGATYNRTIADMNKYIKFEIIPSNATGLGTLTSVVALPVYEYALSLVNVGTGTTTTLSAGGNIAAKVIITNNDTVPHTFVGILGIYDGDKLVGIGMTDAFTVTNGTPVTKTTSGVNVPASSGYTAKILLWQNMNNIVPMATPKVFN